ncbi:MotA/TolQ/ExbB proton channel family protein [Anaeromyxobacter dehalogenans]|jgi:biopolymer transport protein ExbB/TolQ|uniref:Outer membrane transport energization protein ExbB n=1 Tax=Anaeromyxobacter dehalogenans (strain 2CP-C) TaxID=290397 RepID=Q2IML5_ANADE|nr:MotA/TolQ/ExbB proton channel family protein [Anaeromyxobacter dehalogenans]ABC80044.1 outer membrane transport energization protein ExbB [Anaeromyxobacter dehalogenans 2CP-C]
MSLQVIQTLQQLASAQATPEVSFDLLHMWKTMGPFAKFIAGVLAVMSIYSLGVMAERLVTFARAQKASRQFAAALRDLLPAAKFGEAVELSRKLKRGHLPKVLGLAIEEYSHGVEALRTHGPRDVGQFDVIAAVNRAVERSSLRTVNDLRRGLGALATVGSTAPFVGLLGTVAGIITAFQAMAATGSGGLGSVSAGIAEALVTTAFGLLVAIPAVMMFNYLTNRVEDMQVDITDSATELMDFFMKEGRGEAK